MGDVGQPEGFLTQKEAAYYLQCTDRTVKRLLAAGKLPKVHMGNRVYIRADDLAVFTKREEQPSYEDLVRRVVQLEQKVAGLCMDKKAAPGVEEREKRRKLLRRLHPAAFKENTF